MHNHKKYKLLKELPGVKIGTITTNTCANEDPEGKPLDIVFAPGVCEKYPDWFEPIEQRWKPEYDDVYFSIDEVLCILEKPWLNDDHDIMRFDTLNCFKTREQAFTVARRITKLLNDYHEEINK